MKLKYKINLPFAIKEPYCDYYTFTFDMTNKVINTFPKLTNNEKQFIEDIKDYEESLKKECNKLGLSNDKIKEIIWITVKELQKDGIASDNEVKMFLKVCPDYLEFV